MPIHQRRTMTALLWLFGIALYIAFVLIIGWRPIAGALANARSDAIVSMAAVTLAALWVRVLKWRLALGANANAVTIFWLSKAAGEWSPGRVGELSPLLLQRYRTPRIAAWIVLDRVLEMVTTVALGVAGIALIRTPNRTAMILSAAIIIAAILIALFILSQRRLFDLAASQFPSDSRVARGFAFAAETSDDIKRYRGAVPTAIVLTIVPGLMDVWAGMLLYDAFEAPVSFSLMAAVKGLHAITAAVPFTPNATGVPYLTAAVLLHEIGGIPSDKLAAAIALAVALSNVVFWLSAAIAATAFRHSE